MDLWLRFVLAVLATWRLTHLLAREDGPGDLLARLRRRLGEGAAGRFLDCFHCLSVWVAAVAALWLTREPLDWFIATLALSGASCLLQRLGSEPVLIQPHDEPHESRAHHELLRTEADPAGRDLSGTEVERGPSPGP